MSICMKYIKEEDDNDDDDEDDVDVMSIWMKYIKGP